MMLRADIATGETTLDRTDLRLEGALPLVLARQYRSGAPSGIFGAGWQHGLDRTLNVMADRVVYRDGLGRETVFEPVGVGMEARHPSGLTLQHHADVWVVFASPLVQDVFRKGASGSVLPLERLVDPNGNRIKFGYTGGRLAEITGSGGQRIRFVYAGGVVGQIVVTGADGRASAVRTFRYGMGNTLVAETDGLGQTTEYAYQDGLLVRTGSGSAAWLAQYDGDRRCIALWRSDGTAVTHLAYDALRQTTRAIGIDGQQTLYRYAPGTAGTVVLERINAACESFNYYYDEAQHLIGYSAPDGTVAMFQRLDPESGEHFQIDHESRFSNAVLGPGGLLQSVDGGTGGVYAFDYDERFNLVGLTTPLGAAWAFERDRKGRAAAVVSPAGRRVELRREGMALAVEDEEGIRLRLTPDLYGRVAVRTDRRGREQRFRYDAEGRLIGVEVGNGYRVAWEFDGVGRLVRIADSERAEVRRTYDSLGRMLSIESRQGALRLAYDLAGRMQGASGAAGEVQFAYDDQERLTRVEGPTRTAIFGYAAGHVTVTTGEERRVYSVHGELLEDHTPDSRHRQFQYGTRGELIAVEQEEGDDETSTFFEYDADGHLIGVVHDTEAVTLGYDPDGLLTTMGGEGRTLRLDYDARFRPATLHAGEATYRFVFDDGDRLMALEGDGVGCTFQYDALDRCTVFHSAGGTEQRTVAGTAERVAVGDSLAFFVAPHGAALVAEIGTLTLPLWGYEEMRLPQMPFAPRIVRTVVLGAEAALADASTEPGPPVERWSALARAEGFETGVPSATMLGLPWTVLDFFALARDRYDPHFTRRLPGALPHHQLDAARSPDDTLTGSHRTGVLHPRLWVGQAHGSYLASAPLTPSGSLSDVLVLRLYQTLTRS